MTDGDTRRMLLDELLAAKNLDRLVRDAFGSYCVQTAVDVVDEVERPMLLKRLVSYVIDDMHLRATTHGRRLMNKLAKYGCIVDPAPVFQSGPYIPDEHGDHRQYHQQHEVVPTHQDRYLRQFGNHY